MQQKQKKVMQEEFLINIFFKTLSPLFNYTSPPTLKKKCVSEAQLLEREEEEGVKLFCLLASRQNERERERKKNCSFFLSLMGDIFMPPFSQILFGRGKNRSLNKGIFFVSFLSRVTAISKRLLSRGGGRKTQAYNHSSSAHFLLQFCIFSFSTIVGEGEGEILENNSIFHH